MSILNREGDGMHPVLLTLARTLAQEKGLSRDDLINICVPHSMDLTSRARATLTRWLDLGLFIEDGDKVRLNIDLARGETPDAFSERLPNICRGLALKQENGSPLWPADGSVSEDNVGRTADLCRGLAWCLAQDIYSLPSAYTDIERLISNQIQTGRFIFKNDTRWQGLKAWARFLGFAAFDGSVFFCDPTEAVRAELKEVIQNNKAMLAVEFVSRLTERLPVLDSGKYCREIEEVMKPEARARPPAGHLSTALSFALRRLQKQGVLSLITLADAGSQLTLVGRGGRIWESFTHVSLPRDE